MNSDPNRKTLRHFYCRDALWQSFERMSEDFDRGIDDLVNEAMRLLAREKGYLPGEGDGPRSGSSRPAATLPPTNLPRAINPPPPPPGLRSTAAFSVQRPAAAHNLPPPAAPLPLPDPFG